MKVLERAANKNKCSEEMPKKLLMSTEKIICKFWDIGKFVMRQCADFAAPALAHDHQTTPPQPAKEEYAIDPNVRYRNS